MPSPPGTVTPGPTAIVIGAYDSQLKWAAAIRVALEDRGFVCRTVVPTDIRHAVSAEQRESYAQAHLEWLSWDEIIDAGLSSDVVVMGLHGPLVTRFSHDLYQRHLAGAERLPITVSGWVGVIIEKITTGYLARSATDVVCVNSRSDLRTFEGAAHALHLSTENLVLSGLPLLTSGKPELQPGAAAPRAVLFADQPTVPVLRADRLYVYRRLIAYARRHPDRQVILKPRHRIGEDTYHQMQYHPEDLLSGVETPPNFSIDYTSISDQLDHVDLLLTVSSTAALEAVGAGVRVAFVADLGVREQMGNHIFLDSGLLRTFDEIENDDLGDPDAEWVDDYFVFNDGIGPAERIALRVVDLLQTREAGGSTPQQESWSSSFFQTQYRIAEERRGMSEVGEAVAVAAEESFSARERMVMLSRALLPTRALIGLRRVRRRVRRLRRRLATPS